MSTTTCPNCFRLMERTSYCLHCSATTNFVVTKMADSTVSKAAMHDVLRRVWSREYSADEGLEEVMEHINALHERVLEAEQEVRRLRPALVEVREVLAAKLDSPRVGALVAMIDHALEGRGDG